VWYFTWILGLGFALAFGVVNAIWYEVLELQREKDGAADSPAVD
jgi:cyd operon protein YbgT